MGREGSLFARDIRNKPGFLEIEIEGWGYRPDPGNCRINQESRIKDRAGDHNASYNNLVY